MRLRIPLKNLLKKKRRKQSADHCETLSSSPGDGPVGTAATWDKVENEDRIHSAEDDKHFVPRRKDRPDHSAEPRSAP